MTLGILERNKGIAIATIFLLRYLALGTILREKGDSITTYVIKQTIALRLGSKNYTEKLLV